MTVNKIGRPSKAAERRAQILAAMATVVARDGLPGTTVGKVAAAAGLQRTLVLHYFGDRTGLIKAFIDETVGAYGDAMLIREAPAEAGTATVETVEDAITSAFTTGFYSSREDLVIWTELVALAARDDEIRARLRALWLTRWLPQIEARLRHERPAARAGQISAVTYGLACLVEAHWAFHLQGVASPERTRQAQDAARTLIGTLPPMPARDPEF